MKRLWIPALVCVLLLACVAGFYATSSSDAGQTRRPASGAAQVRLVDDGLLQTARQLAPYADTPEQQDLAREALRLADHELDQAYATALRAAAAVPAPASGPLRELNQRIAQLKAQVASGKDRVAQLTKQAETSDEAADQLAVVQAQQELDEDDLEDAQQDLSRQGGDRHAILEQALQQHETSHQGPPQFKTAAQSAGTLVQQIPLWIELNNRSNQLEAARDQANNKAAQLLKEHQALEQQAGKAPDAGAPSTAGVARLKQLSAQRKTLTEYDKRIQDCRQLAATYTSWDAAVGSAQRGAVHLILESVAIILVVILAVVLIGRAMRRAFQHADRRRIHQMRTVSTLAVQATGLVIILLIIFGPPTQVTTLLGLATAGLTVALKDFILGFLGWFVLLGRNGLHIGDWVEIEGVGGEVIEIGLLKTVLLEVGNWSATGHPTGRRVSFVNSFAIEGHFFNFSTAGQWLWDQIQVTIPGNVDPYRIAEQISQAVARETAADSTAAEQDWQRVTTQYGVRDFSAKPAVDLRPGSAGLEVVVRYITRAPQRFEVKSRLFQIIVELLHQAAAAPHTA
jgi:small-conductance mechanosensitive channel